MAKDKKDNLENFFSNKDEKEGLVKEEVSEKSFDVKVSDYGKKKPQGKVANIVGTEAIIVEMSDGTGQRIPYNPQKHAGLKKGDLVDV